MPQTTKEQRIEVISQFEGFQGSQNPPKFQEQPSIISSNDSRKSQLPLIIAQKVEDRQICPILSKN